MNIKEENTNSSACNIIVSYLDTQLTASIQLKTKKAFMFTVRALQKKTKTMSAEITLRENYK